MKKIIIFSGAGLSAESGISTFRDTNGLWENHKIDEICNEYTWRKNFNKVHQFYNDRRTQLKFVEPNEAHKTIKRLYDKFSDDLIIITQNVDDLLERTGIPKDKIIHLHGFLPEMQCTSCNNIWNVKYENFDSTIDSCPNCGSVNLVKPNIVFFNGAAPEYAKLYDCLDYLETQGSYLVVVGTNGNVVTIDNLTKRIPKERKILNNLEKSEYIKERNFGQIFYEPAGTALPKIEKFLIENFKAK